MHALLMLAAMLPMLKECPKIDGTFDPAEWKGALSFDFDGGRGAKGYLAFTGKEFVYAARMKHENKEWIFSYVKKHDSGVYDDDSVDMYFTVPGRKGYRHVIANYCGTIYDAQVDDDTGKVDKKWESDARAAGGFDDATGMMTIEVAVPVDTIAPPDGKVSLCLAYFIKWLQYGDQAFGTRAKPLTFTTFELDKGYPEERIVKARPEGRLLSVIEHSDILWEGENPELEIFVKGGQKAPVRVTFENDTATCAYLDEKVEVKFRRERSPWQKEAK